MRVGCWGVLLHYQYGDRGEQDCCSNCIIQLHVQVDKVVYWHNSFTVMTFHLLRLTVDCRTLV